MNSKHAPGEIVALNGRTFRLRRPARECYYWEAVQLDGHPACAGSIQIIDQRKFVELAFGDAPPAGLIGMLVPKHSDGMFAAKGAFEVRRNHDSSLDEVVGSGDFHLEQMSGSHWWMALDTPRGRVTVHLQSKTRINANCEIERSKDQP